MVSTGCVQTTKHSDTAEVLFPTPPLHELTAMTCWILELPFAGKTPLVLLKARHRIHNCFECLVVLILVNASSTDTKMARVIAPTAVQQEIIPPPTRTQTTKTVSSKPEPNAATKADTWSESLLGWLMVPGFPVRASSPLLSYYEMRTETDSR